MKFLKHICKRHFYFLIIIFCVSTSLVTFYFVSFSQVQFEWAKQIGGTGADLAKDSYVDSSGNIYTTGTFEGAIDFDPGAGTYNLTSAGSSDIYISKLDSDGSLVWARVIAGTGDDTAGAISIDSEGFVYVTGSFVDTADFDPGVGTYNLTSPGSAKTDIFILKLDSNGDFVWAKNLGGTGNDQGFNVTVDSFDNVLTTGRFATGPVDFDPGVGTTNLSPVGGIDIFILKLDSDGNFVWVKAMGGAGAFDVAFTVDVDDSDNVYTSGYFQDTADFDPGAGTYNLTSASAGVADIFISKLDLNGDFVWANKIGGTNVDQGINIAIGSDNNIYLVGFYGVGGVDFDPGVGTYDLTSVGGADVFILKLDLDGNFVWANSVGGTTVDNGKDIIFDSYNNVYITGTYNGTADFDPGAGTYDLTSVGGADVFILKLDLDGNFVLAKTIGETGVDSGQAIGIDSNDNIYLSGYFNNTLDVDPDSGTYDLISLGSSDIFLLKLILTDIIPDAFLFTDQTDILLSTEYESNEITIAGINNTSDISITSCTGTICEYSINSGVYTDIVGTIVNGDTVKVHQTSSSLNNTTTDLVLDIGGVTDTFSLTTIPETRRSSGSYLSGYGPNAIKSLTVNNEIVTGEKEITQEVIKEIIVGSQGSKFLFNKNLRLGMEDKDIFLLQKFLNENGFILTQSGPGSPGNETDKFGVLTFEAVKKLQKKNKINILDPLNLKEPTGFFGPFTRKYVNGLNNN